jgi:hypothetical protein
MCSSCELAKQNCDQSDSTTEEESRLALIPDGTPNIWSHPEQPLKHNTVLQDAQFNFVELPLDTTDNNHSWKLNKKEWVQGEHFMAEVSYVVSTNADELVLKLGKHEVNIFACDVDRNGIWTKSAGQQKRNS